LGLYRLFPGSAWLNHYYLGHLPPQSNHAVEVLAGAFMLVKKSVLDQVGSFDEQFFMYGEDIDLSYRITQAGYRNYYFAGSTIIHFKGESTSRHSLQYVRVFYQAMQLFVTKHFKGTGAGLYRALLYAGIGLRGSVGFVAGMLRGNSTTVVPSQVSLHVVPSAEEANLPAKAMLQDKEVSLVYKQGSEQSLAVAGNGSSVAEAIRLLEQQGQFRTVWLHIAGTRSLVMSNNKNRNGTAAEFIHLQRD
jgi:hypothetical protein